MLFLASCKLVIPSGIEIVSNCRPDWLMNPYTGRNLELDVFIPKWGVAFEIQGQHHYTDEWQKTKDEIKRNILEKEDVVLFELSVKQIDPSTLRRKLLNLSYCEEHRARGIRLNVYNHEEWNEHREKCKRYKLLMESKYTGERALNPVSNFKRYNNKWGRQVSTLEQRSFKQAVL
jgi:hypothetical protein